MGMRRILSAAALYLRLGLLLMAAAGVQAGERPRIAIIIDDLNEITADLTLLSANVTTNGGATTLTNGVEYNFSNVGGKLTFDFTPYLIPAFDQLQVEIELVADDTNAPGTTFFNTARWTFGRVIPVDLDGDGKIPEKEFNEARASRISERAKQGYPMRNVANAPPFSNIDTNGDGAISEEEFTSSQSQHRQQMQKYREMRMEQGRGMRQGMGPGRGMGRNMPAFSEFDLDRSIYVIDVRQSLYMKQIFKLLDLMGNKWAKDCYHLAYEIVNLPGNVTIASREGTVVLLEDLISEAEKRAFKIVEDKNAELDEKIKKDKLKMMLKYLARQKKLVFHQGEYIHTTIIDKSRKTLLMALNGRERGITPGVLPSTLRVVLRTFKIAPGDFVEPATLGLEGRCSIRVSYVHNNFYILLFGAPGRIRTCYPRLRRPMLYPSELQAQIFKPVLHFHQYKNSTNKRNLVGVERFELPTSCSQSRRATRLRYTPTLLIHTNQEAGNITLCSGDGQDTICSLW